MILTSVLGGVALASLLIVGWAVCETAMGRGGQLRRRLNNIRRAGW